MRVRRTIAGTFAAALLFAGCTDATGNSAAGTPVLSASTTIQSATAGSSPSAAPGSSAASTTPSSTAASTAASSADVQAVLDRTHYDADDLTFNADDAVDVALADGASTGGTGAAVKGNVVTITAAGTYHLSGSLTDGQVVIAAGEQDTVRLILDGVSLTSTTTSPFVVQSADEVLVYLADGSTNSLTDAATYADTSEEAPSAALYSKADLTIAGSGSLTVKGQSNDGIHSSDGLVLVSGTVTVTAVDDGIVGKDYLVLLDGDWTVTAGGDGVKSDNEADSDRGYLLVAGGELTVDSGDDGVKAYNTLGVTGGTVTVANSVEGLESQHITISGGTVDVTSSDDGVNAAGGASGGSGGGEDVGDFDVTVTGGALTVNSEGDGLDSNGNAAISGGTVVINGPSGAGNGALDVNGDLKITGGVVAAAGSSGMAVVPSISSTQSGLQITFTSAVEAGTAVSIVAADGTVVSTFVTTKSAQSLVFSSPDIKAGQTYTVYTGGTTDVKAGLGAGSIDGATKNSTVVAGQYTAGGFGGGGGGNRRPGG
jgi:hypothetical protein